MNMNRKQKIRLTKYGVWILASPVISGTLFFLWFILTAILNWGGDFDRLNYIPVFPFDKDCAEQLQAFSYADFDIDNSYAIYAPSLNRYIIVEINRPTNFINIECVGNQNGTVTALSSLPLTEIFEVQKACSTDVFPKLDGNYFLNYPFLLMFINKELAVRHSKECYAVLLIITLIGSFYPISKIIDKQNLFQADDA